VHLEAQAVPRAVPERVAEPVAGQDVAVMEVGGAGVIGVDARFSDRVSWRVTSGQTPRLMRY